MPEILSHLDKKIVDIIFIIWYDPYYELKGKNVMYNASQLLKELENMEIDMVNFDTNGKSIPTKPTAFIGDNGMIHVSAEESDGLVDYHGECYAGIPYIHSKLVEWAGSNGCLWDWKTPGCIVLVKR